MTSKAALLALTAVVLVAGCNRGSTANKSTSNTTTTTNTAAAAPAAPAAGGTVDRAFVVGHWGSNGDCSRTVSFNADGTGSATGEENAGGWSLEGNNLVLTAPGDPTQRVPVSRSGDNLVMSGPQGQQATMTRCASAGVAPAGSASESAAGNDAADEE